MAVGDRLLLPSGRRILLPDGRRKMETTVNFNCGCCSGLCTDLLGGNPRIRVILSVTPCAPQTIDHTQVCEPPPGPASIQYSGQFTPLDISGAYTLGFQQPPGSFYWERSFNVSQTVMTWSVSGQCGATGGGVSGGVRANRLIVSVFCNNNGNVQVGATVETSLFGNILGSSLTPCPVQGFVGVPQQGFQIPGIPDGANRCPAESADFPGFWDCADGAHAVGQATVEIL